jgi:hypothetical protein
LLADPDHSFVHPEHSLVHHEIHLYHPRLSAFAILGIGIGIGIINSTTNQFLFCFVLAFGNEVIGLCDTIKICSKISIAHE